MSAGPSVMRCLDAVAYPRDQLNGELAMKRIILTCIAGLALSSNIAFAYPGQSLIKQAAVTMEQARAIALKARPGKKVDEELEKEKGGSGLRFSFDIKDATGLWEVGVDAKTGKILENKREPKNPD